MTERENKIRQRMKAERQRQLGELVEKIVHAIPAVLQAIVYFVIGYIGLVLVLCLCG